jgi:2-keto-4-pentenoate hydratase
MGTTLDIEAATESIWRHLQAGRHYPAEWGGRLDMRQGYEIQLGILARLAGQGERHAGWKVGLTAAAMRAQHNVHEPCFGFLLESGNRPSGHVFRHADLIQPGFENEICISVGRTLRGPGVTFEQARAAVAAIAPALEIVEKRGNFSADLPLTMADNAQQKAFVTGAAIPLGEIDLSQATVTVYVNDAVRDRASGAEVMGNPIHSIVWLANKLAEFGRALEAGQRVISGSFTRQYALDGPARVRSVFEPVGSVEATFA